MIRPLALGLLGLAACSADPVGPDQPGPGSTCPASQLAPLVGQPQSAAAGISHGGEMRLIRPGMAVTMDYSPARLNVEIGTDGRIARIFCG